MIAGTEFNARALLLGTRLDLRAWPESETLARMPLAVRVPGGGIAVLFRHGAAVLFGVTPEAERVLRERLAPLVENRYASADEETLAVRVEPGRAEGLVDGALMLQAGGVAQLQLVADVLSKSSLLAHYETRLASEFDRLEPFALQLERRGANPGSTREHMKRIGALDRKSVV